MSDMDLLEQEDSNEFGKKIVDKFEFACKAADKAEQGHNYV